MKNKLILLICGAVLFASCKKSKNEGPQPEPAPQPDPVFVNPEMNYRNMNGYSVGFQEGVSFDVNNDGRKDIVFRTQSVSYDGNTKVKVEYLAEVGITSKLAVDPNNETVPRLQEKQLVTEANRLGFEWYNIASVALLQKVYTAKQSYWEGKYKEPGKAFLPFQLIIDGKTHLGWVELKADLGAERLYIYRIAYSKLPANKIYAGVVQ